MTRRAAPEAAIQRSIVAMLRAVVPAPGIITASGHEQRGHGKAAMLRQMRLREMGTLAGTPDLLVIADGITCWLEVKAPGGSLQPNQRAFRDAMAAQGVAWALVRSPDEALAAVHAAGIRTRAAKHRIGGAE